MKFSPGLKGAFSIRLAFYIRTITNWDLSELANQEFSLLQVVYVTNAEGCIAHKYQARNPLDKAVLSMLDFDGEEIGNAIYSKPIVYRKSYGYADLNPISREK